MDDAVIKALVERATATESAVYRLQVRLDALEEANNDNPRFNEPSEKEVWQYVTGPDRGWYDFPLWDFFRYWRAEKWIRKNGKPVKNWKNTARQWYGNRSRYR